MNDKTLKIRIKLHSTETPVKSLNAEPVEFKQRTLAPPIADTTTPKRLPWLAGTLGLAALVLVTGYVINGEEFNHPGKAAFTADHESVEAVQIVNKPSSETQLRNPDTNRDSVALDSQGPEDDLSTVKPANSAIDGPETDAFDPSPDKTSANIDRESISSEANPEVTNPPITPSEYAAFDDVAKNLNTAESSLSADSFAATTESADNGSTLTENSIRNEGEPVAMSETGSELIRTEPLASSYSRVSRAQLTRGIQAREPIDRVEKVFHSEGKKLKRLYYFTELRGMKGDSVVHRWTHKGDTVANITFNINGDRWRIYSSKFLPSSMKGRWNVVVTDSSGKRLVSDSFIYD